MNIGCNDDGWDGEILCKFYSFILQKLKNRGREVLRGYHQACRGGTGLAEKSQSEIFCQDLPRAQQYNWEEK